MHTESNGLWAILISDNGVRFAEENGLWLLFTTKRAAVRHINVMMIEGFRGEARAVKAIVEVREVEK